MRTFALTVNENAATGEFEFEFPEAFRLEQGWREGDTLQFTPQGVTGFIVANVSKSAREADVQAQAGAEIFLVETLSTFRMRYAIRADSAEAATAIVLSPVTAGILNDFDQEHLGESVCSVSAMTEAQVVQERPDYMTAATMLNQIYDAHRG